MDDVAMSNTRVQGGLSFIALCELTVILGDILPLIYTLQAQTPEQASRALRRHETALDQWEEGLLPWLRPGSVSFERQAAGSLNLQLCYLVSRMCLWRLGLLVRISFITFGCLVVHLTQKPRSFIDRTSPTLGKIGSTIRQDAERRRELL